MSNNQLKYLDVAGKSYFELGSEIYNTIELLKARRAALITAVVTGQLDLKELAV